MDPVITFVYDLQIRYFGILLAIGLALMFVKVRRNFLAAKINLSRDATLNWFIVTLIYGVVGARIYYVLFHLEHYFSRKADWFEIFAIWRGGLSFHGGIILAIFSIWLMCRLKSISFAQVTDLIVAPLLIVQAFVCIGNFINGELSGIPTNNQFGVIFSYGPASILYPETRVHPTFVYSSLLYFVGFFVLDVISKGRSRAGLTASCYLLWYSSIQLLIGFISVPELTIYSIDESRIVSVAGLVISVSLIIGKGLYRKPPSRQRQFPSARDRLL